MSAPIFRAANTEILLLIAGMVVIGSLLEVTGLAQAGAAALIDVIRPYGPWVAL